jgi:antirestriction protein ArdC
VIKMKNLKKDQPKKTVYQVITERVIEQLKTGKIAWKKQWKASAPCNYVSGHRYQGINHILLQSSGTTPYWLTYNNITKLNGTLKPGEIEKPQVIVYWMFSEKEVLNKRTSKMETKKIPFLRYFKVYNWDQCDGIPMKEVSAITLHDPIDKCEEIIEKSGANIKYVSSDKAYYSPSQDMIGMPDKKYFKELEYYYSTTFHELTHWSGAKERCNRDGITHEGFDETNPSNSYSFEELVAEFGAAFLCSEAGIDNDETMENSAAYIANWIGKLEDNPQWLVKAATKAQHGADWVLGKRKVEPEVEDAENSNA